MAMGGMSAAGWSVGAALVFVGVWTVMMAAMMLPAAAPMILTFASAQARRDHAAAIPTWIFIAGYLFVWSAVGVVVYGLVQVGADASSYLGSVDRAIWGPLVLGVTLVGAGVYQFTRSNAFACVIAALRWRLWRCTGRRSARGGSHGDLARRILSRLLLGAVRHTGCRGNHELGLDAGAHFSGVRRKGVPAWPTRFGNYRRCPDRLGGGGGWFDLLKLHHSAPGLRGDTVNGSSARHTCLHVCCRGRTCRAAAKATRMTHWRHSRNANSCAKPCREP